ncbi:uncharacterized protein [Mytilus edulis]|uniref:uncharacterized protein n=1 Tax=Mytilus edulis TaxID=6550 RepID=UPI0039F14799
MMCDLLCWITILVLLFSDINSEIYEFDSNGPCCNGTLGYAYYNMPCSSLKCCNSSETVSVSLVNAALGYVFRCTDRSEVKKDCTKRGKLMIDSKVASTKYGTRICCEGLVPKIYFNQPSAALAVECVDYLR